MSDHARLNTSARLRCLAKPLFVAAQSRDRFLLFALFLFLTILRMPNVVFQGRFWAEEGKVFYVHAATMSWLHAIFNSYAGYMNLGANLAAVVARHLVTLEYAPRVTLFFALLAQLCPAVLLLTSNAAWLRSRVSLAASLLLLVAAPSAEEVWLNTLHSQFHLALCVALILALDIEPGIRELFRRFLLFLAPLYGLVAIVVLPLFVLRTIINRSRARLIQTLVLMSGSAIQMLFFYHVVNGRQTLDIKLILATFFAKNIVLPFLSFGMSGPIDSWLHAALDQGHLPVSVVIVILVSMFALFALMRRTQAACWWLSSACVTIALVSYYGVWLGSSSQVEPHLYGRYAFVPQVLFAWTLIMIASSGPWPRNRIALIFVVWLTLASMNAYFVPDVSFKKGPNWHEEVAKWRNDHTYSPLVWPGGKWNVPMPLLSD